MGLFYLGIAAVTSFAIIQLVFKPKRFQWRGKTVLITGGSQGIGFEIATLLREAGASLILVARNQTKLDKAKDELESMAGEGFVRVISLDVSSAYEDVVQTFSDELAEEGIVVDAAIMNAGTSIAGEARELPASEFERMMRVNYLGSVYPIKALLETSTFVERGGRIAFVSSQAGQVAIWGYSAYGASKYALRGFAEALSMELGPSQDHIVSVCYPPDTDTPGFKEEERTKPELTRLLSDATAVTTPRVVAQGMIQGIEEGRYHISVGLDGWLLANLCCGMSPIQHGGEVLQQVLVLSLARFISIPYLVEFSMKIKGFLRKQKDKKTPSNRKRD